MNIAFYHFWRKFVGRKVALEHQEGTSSESVPSVDPIDQIFDKSHIDNKLGAFKSNFSPQDDSPDSESKRFKIQIEAKKLKFKGNEKQFFF